MREVAGRSVAKMIDVQCVMSVGGIRSCCWTSPLSSCSEAAAFINAPERTIIVNDQCGNTHSLLPTPTPCWKVRLMFPGPVVQVQDVALPHDPACNLGIGGVEY